MKDTAFSKIVSKPRSEWGKIEICIYALWSEVLGMERIAIEAADELAAKDAEIARLTSEVAELRRLGDGMAERLELFSFYADLVKRNPSALRANAIFEDNDAAALEDWERATK